jgi:hypothetical protein
MHLQRYPRSLLWLIVLAIFVTLLAPWRAKTWEGKAGPWFIGGYGYRTLDGAQIDINHVVTDGQIHFCLYFDGQLLVRHRATWLEQQTPLPPRLCAASSS